MKYSLTKQDLSILIGNGMDHFDTALYGFLAPILSQIFFPAGDEVVNLILAYSVLATSLFTRPIGSYLFGHIAKKQGGVHALSYSLIGVAISTTLIGFIPNYRNIGWLSTLLLVVIRLIQGIFAEGESSIAKLYILENKLEQQAFTASYLYQMSTMLGIILASGVSTILIASEYHPYWRLCFIFGGFTGLVGYFLRKNSLEKQLTLQTEEVQLNSQSFRQDKFKEEPTQSIKIRRDRQVPKNSLVSSFVNLAVSDLQLLWNNKLNIMRISLVIGFSYVTYIIPFVFMNSFLPLISAISLEEMMEFNTILLILDMIMIPVIGRLVQNFAYKKVIITSLVVMGLSIIPLWINLENASIYYINFVRLWIVVWGVVFLCPMNLWLNDLFKTSNKYILVGIGGALGSSIFGRLTPSIALLLWHLTHNSLSISIYITIMIVVTILAVHKT